MENEEPRDPDLEPVEAIYDALDYGDAETALMLARRSLAEAGESGQDPVLHFLAGVALLELDRPADAVVALELAVRLDPDDAEFHSRLAEALFSCCRFDQAEHEARRAIAADSRLPHGYWMIGLALERSGDYHAADNAVQKAADLSPDEFYVPVRMSREEFDQQLGTAIASLPERFRAHLDDVTVAVEDLPSDELLLAEDPPLDPELLGLFVGAPCNERSVLSPGGELPAMIYLFQRNIERVSIDNEELREEIAITLRHELGHYLGLDEDEIARAGHA
ncbi:MAG TPA: metallopeptidase family protein [Candidatus Polarisedimenticolaceae bacterium]|nr:metallopeptidase family protein [Candidatus Polarisedimenticolaceae bacterium]